MSVLRIRLGRRKTEVTRPLIIGQPLIVSYGLGVDSTAMLIEMHKRGIRPDIIYHAHTGSEKPATYEYLPVMNSWLESVGFPLVTEVYTNSTKYRSLADACDNTETMPSKAYGLGSCSSRWKVELMQREVNNNEQCQLSIQAAGMPVIRAIGLDASPRDCARFNKAPQYSEGDTQHEIYPLQDWNISRPQCLEIIQAAGLPLPVKSACYMCPSSHSNELAGLEDIQLARSLRIEARAIARTLRDKPRVPTTIGLGRKWNWRDTLASTQPERLARLDKQHDTGHRIAYDNALEINTRDIAMAATQAAADLKCLKVRKQQATAQASAIRTFNHAVQA